MFGSGGDKPSKAEFDALRQRVVLTEQQLSALQDVVVGSDGSVAAAASERGASGLTADDVESGRQSLRQQIEELQAQVAALQAASRPAVRQPGEDDSLLGRRQSQSFMLKNIGILALLLSLSVALQAGWSAAASAVGGAMLDSSEHSMPEDVIPVSILGSALMYVLINVVGLSITWCLTNGELLQRDILAGSDSGSRIATGVLASMALAHVAILAGPPTWATIKQEPAGPYAAASASGMAVVDLSLLLLGCCGCAFFQPQMFSDGTRKFLLGSLAFISTEVATGLMLATTSSVGRAVLNTCRQDALDHDVVGHSAWTGGAGGAVMLAPGVASAYLALAMGVQLSRLCAPGRGGCMDSLSQAGEVLGKMFNSVISLNLVVLLLALLVGVSGAGVAEAWQHGSQESVFDEMAASATGTTATALVLFGVEALVLNTCCAPGW